MLRNVDDRILVHCIEIIWSFTIYVHRYADILIGKLQQKVTAIDKLQATRKILREKIEQFKRDKQAIQPLIGKLTDQTIQLQEKVWIYE